MLVNIVYDVCKRSIYSMYVSGGKVSTKLWEYLENKISENPLQPNDWRIKRYPDYYVSSEMTALGPTSQNGIYRDYTFEC